MYEIDNKNAELMKRALLLFSKQKCSRGITSVSALRSLLKLKNMKESQRLCTILENYGVLTKLGKGGRTTSYKVELGSPAFARVFNALKVNCDADDDDSPTDCEDDSHAESDSDLAGNLSQDEHTKRHRTSPYRNLQSKKRRTRDYAHVKSPIHLTPDYSKTFKSGSRPSRRFKTDTYFDQSETF